MISSRPTFFKIRAESDRATAEERRNLETIAEGTRDFNARRAGDIARSFAEDYVWVSPFFNYRPMRGIREAKRGLESILTLFPDTRYDIQLNLAQGSFTETLFTVRGTRVEGFMGLPPQDVDYEFVTSVVNEFDSHGRRIRTWETWDRLHLLQQLGVAVTPNNSLAEANRPSGGPETSKAAVPPYRPGGGAWQTIEKRNYESVARGIVAFNAREAEKSVADLAPDSVWRSNAFPEPIIGKEQAGRYIAKSFEYFPDTTFELIHMLAWRDFVHVIFLARGTQSRGFLGLPARDRPFQYFRSVLSRYDRHGQRAEVWDVWDEAAVLRDQGFIPWTVGRGSSTLLSMPAARSGEAGHVLTRELISQLEDRISPQMAPDIQEALSQIPRLNMIGIVKEVNHSREGQVTWLIDLHETSIRTSMTLTLGKSLGSARIKTLAPSSRARNEGRDSTGRCEETGDPGNIQFSDKSNRSFSISGTSSFAISQGADAATGCFGLVQRIHAGSPQEIQDGVSFLTMTGVWPVTTGSPVHLCLRMQKARRRRSRSKSMRTSPGPSGDLVLVLASRLDLGHSHSFQYGPRGEFRGGEARERVSVADFQVSLKRNRTLEVSLFQGLPVGTFSFAASFPESLPMDGTLCRFQMPEARIKLYDSSHRELGCIVANIADGRAYRTTIDDLSGPLFALAGTAPIQRGSRVLSGVEGMLSLNSLHTAVPQGISSILTLQLKDPHGALASRLARAWAS